LGHLFQAEGVTLPMMIRAKFDYREIDFGSTSDFV